MKLKKYFASKYNTATTKIVSKKKVDEIHVDWESIEQVTELKTLSMEIEDMRRKQIQRKAKVTFNDRQ